jgi:two-component system copper resistance phosphate regulon response regulator CusR
MKVLLIEDDEKTRTAVRNGLTQLGFEVLTCANGAEALTAAFDMTLDVILLDMMLPTRDGWTVLTELRSKRCHTPIIVLSALEAVEHRVKALTLGADDYLVKPFALSELAARIKTILRRGRAIETDVLAAEDLRMDPRKHEVFRSGKRIDLSLREFALLELLVRNRGHVLSRSYIADHIWDMVFDSESNVVDVNVRRLRAKIDDPFPKKLIHTIRGRGYVLR